MSTYEISKSSLLSLKAEILKKQDEVNKAKLENKTRIQRKIGHAPLELKNKGVEERAAGEESVEDVDLLRQSRIALEAKSKLYDKLSQGSHNAEEKEKNRRYLVHFDKKARKTNTPNDVSFDEEEDSDKYPESEDEPEVNEDEYKAENYDDEWVEYTDYLGRTRSCLRKDLVYLKEKDNGMKRDARESVAKEPVQIEEKEERDEHSDIESFNDESEMLSGDMRRELQRQKWEKEEEEIKNKSDVHYQDILFNEARSHGVGYYGFSKDEHERANQQDALRKLRKETEAKQRQAQEIKINRGKQLASRILAAKNRKRARMGLPPLTSDDEEPQNSMEKEATKEEKPLDPEMLEVEKEKDIKRKLHVRPWDKGKEGVKEHVEYSQKEWVDIQRKQRISDFAPPRSYTSDKLMETTPEEDRGLYFTTNRRKHIPTESSAHFSVDTSKPPPNIRNPSKKYVNPYKQAESLGQPLPFAPTPIVNECSDDEEEDVDDRLLQDYKRSGVEIAPPPTYDYYGPTGSKRSKPMHEKGNMEDSIMMGLKYLRAKVEKKDV